MAMYMYILVESILYWKKKKKRIKSEHVDWTIKLIIYRIKDEITYYLAEVVPTFYNLYDTERYTSFGSNREFLVNSELATNAEYIQSFASENRLLNQVYFFSLDIML